MLARTHLTAALLLAALGAAGAPALAQDQPAPAHQPQLAPDAGAMLDELEAAGQDLVSLRARLKYDKTSELQGDRQVRLGDLYYVSGRARADAADAQPPAPDGRGQKFAIRFDEQWLDGARRDEDLTYIFDGEWLVEKYPQQQPPLFLKRQVVAPGQNFNPLRIGEGPFPIPIGQRKADILSRYHVELLPARAGLEREPDGAVEDGPAPQDEMQAVEGSRQLRLTPRPEVAENEDFEEIRLWYRKNQDGVLLPRMARTISKGGDTTTVLLLNTQVQLVSGPENPRAAVPPDILDTTPPRDGWQVQVEPYRGGPAPAAPRGADERP